MRVLHMDISACVFTLDGDFQEVAAPGEKDFPFVLGVTWLALIGVQLRKRKIPIDYLVNPATPSHHPPKIYRIFQHKTQAFSERAFAVAVDKHPDSRKCEQTPNHHSTKRMRWWRDGRLAGHRDTKPRCAFRSPRSTVPRRIGSPPCRCGLVWLKWV